MRIGFFDSGIGGISVLHEALRRLPREDYLYYADVAHVPYGAKSKAEVKQYVFTAVDFIVRQQVKAVVVACNTATSVAIGDLRTRYDIPILGMEPAVKPALEKDFRQQERILVTATPLTVREEKLQQLIARLDQAHRVDTLPLPGLVEFAERFEFSAEVVLRYLRKQLRDYETGCYGTVVLGCTHFPFYKDCFRTLFPQADIIDGNMGTVQNLQRILKAKQVLGEGSGKVDFYHSGVKLQDSAAYQRLFDRLAAIRE